MPFDTRIWERPSVGGDVGGVAIETVVALRAIHAALDKLAAASAVNIKAELDTIEIVMNDLHETFNHLAGWINPNDT